MTILDDFIPYIEDFPHESGSFVGNSGDFGRFLWEFLGIWGYSGDFGSRIVCPGGFGGPGLSALGEWLIRPCGEDHASPQALQA